MSPQAITEFYAWCVLLLVCGLAFVFMGIPGTLCVIAGVIVSQIDLGWIKDTLEAGNEPADTAPSQGWRHIPLPPNVVPLEMHRKTQKG